MEISPCGRDDRGCDRLNTAKRKSHLQFHGANMNISHLGAKDCVTGSCHLIQTAPGSADSINILVDCGSAYGDDPELPFDQFPVAPEAIQYLFLTHAHIDHIGRVPDLIDAGFRGEIICTHATKALLLPMLRDAMSFSREQWRKNDRERLEVLLDKLSWGFELHQTFSLKKGITFKLSNAGHILGSCFILFTFPDDHGNEYESCDLLILESTYGNRTHPNRKNRIEALRNLLHKALADKGIVYIPAFALWAEPRNCSMNWTG
jgi:metallo-beta-lactamase family protein